MLIAEKIEAGRDTDALIHEKVFKRTDDPPPYSTDQKTAEWLAEKYVMHAMPVRSLGDMKWDDVAKEPVGPTIAYGMITRCEPTGEGPGKDGLLILATADTFPLAVSRSVLMLEGLAELGGRVEYF